MNYIATNLIEEKDFLFQIRIFYTEIVDVIEQDPSKGELVQELKELLDILGKSKLNTEEIGIIEPHVH